MKAVAARPPVNLGLLGPGAPLRSLRERVLQTLAFEAGGLVFAAPLYPRSSARRSTIPSCCSARSRWPA